MSRSERVQSGMLLIIRALLGKFAEERDTATFTCTLSVEEILRGAKANFSMELSADGVGVTLRYVDAPVILSVEAPNANP